MLASYPSTMLRTNQRDVKDAASAQPVIVTDNAAYFVLVARDALGKTLKAVKDQAAYQQQVVEAVERGRADFAAGRCIEGTAEEVIARMELGRLARG